MDFTNKGLVSDYKMCIWSHSWYFVDRLRLMRSHLSWGPALWRSAPFPSASFSF